MSDHAGACFVCGTGLDQSDERPTSLSRRSMLFGAAAVPLAAAGAMLALRPSSAQAQAAKFQPPKGPYVLEPDWTLARRNDETLLLRGASVVVRDDKIEAVHDGAVAGDMTRFKLPGQLLLPGFISGHTHVCSATPTRGIIEGGRSFARPLELVEMLSDDEMDALTAFNLAELLRSGCTTQVEMSLSLRQAKSYVRVAKKWGVRGYPSGMVPGIARLFPIWFRREDAVLTASGADTLKEIADNLAFAKEVLATGGGRLIPMMAAYATDTHTPETMGAIVAAARELKSAIHIHLSQSTRETETVKRLWGVSPTQWLEKLGAFAGPVFGAHLTGLDWDTDVAILKKHNFVYSHCPTAGGAGGTGGMQPFPEALAAGLPVNVGIDTHSGDYVENMKLAVLLGRTRARIMQAMGSKAAMKMPTIWSAIDGATNVPAKALGRPDLGRIEAGAKADLVSIDVSDFLVGAGRTPPEPINNLLYANGTAVRHVMTDGVFQVFDGHLVADDEATVIRNGGVAVEKIWKRLADEGWFKPTPR